MALTVATGFVVDDAIVVMENTTPPHRSGHAAHGRRAPGGARKWDSPSCPMSLSLVAVFVPFVFIGGLVGLIFREFIVTLSVSILISLVIR